ncbi:MAG: hypothetical protein A4E72_00774 [Syntrophus sp. PtaU1.Bin208]|nr:MAG: hypothetical protein A4E72_00774 [Syntrophus sp. PtaU1.Bin208]
MKKPFPITETRQALKDALPAGDEAMSTPEREAPFTYVPPSHAAALNPENPIVEGIRGAGKSFWWGALVSEPHRLFVASAFPEAKIDRNTLATQGFGIGPSSRRYPSKDVIETLVQRFDARHIWRAIIATQIDAPDPYPSQGSNWDAKVSWVKDHPEEMDELLYQRNAELAEQKKLQLILFDALDRLADDWDSIRPLARSLFQVALDFRSYQNIRLKIFVRPDMLEDRDILAFPDSSKLLARKISLKWRRSDLYALVFQCLGNANSGGEDFRNHCLSEFGLKWHYDAENTAWVLPKNLRIDEDVQKELFHAMTGPAMASGASGHKRGFPYTWLPNHLMDGRSEVSPRSFCAALRVAAQEEPLKGWDYPLHYKGIQAGVQQASSIRVNEISREDYPWIETVMNPLKGKITVPCLEREITAIWKKIE